MEQSQELQEQIIEKSPEKRPYRKITINGEHFDTFYNGPSIIQGYMKKRGSDNSYLNQNKYLLRYFILDLNIAQLQITHAPNKKGKIIKFREMLKISQDHVDKDPYGDKDFPYAFILHTQGRKFFLGCGSRQEKDMWMSGFTVLFDYGKWTKEKYEKLQQMTVGKIQANHPASPVQEKSGAKQDEIQENQDDLNDRIENDQNATEEVKIASPKQEQSSSKVERVLTVEDEREKLNEERKKLLEAQEEIQRQKLELEREKLNLLAQQIQEQQKELHESFKKNSIKLQRGRSIQESKRENQLEVEEITEENDVDKNKYLKTERDESLNQKPPMQFDRFRKRGISQNPQKVQISQDLKQKLKMNACNISKVQYDAQNNSINDIQQEKKDTVTSQNGDSNNNEGMGTERKSFQRKRIVIKKPKSILTSNQDQEYGPSASNQYQNTIEYSQSPLLKQNQQQTTKTLNNRIRKISENCNNTSAPSAQGLFNQFRRRSVKPKKKEDIVIDTGEDIVCQEDLKIGQNPKNDEHVKVSELLNTQPIQLKNIITNASNLITDRNSGSIYDMMSPEKKIDPIKNILTNNNNVSTIDTLIERERDSSFLDRLDKQNKQNLKSSNIKARLNNQSQTLDNQKNGHSYDPSSRFENQRPRGFENKQNSFVEHNPWNWDDQPNLKNHNQEHQYASRNKSSSNVLGFLEKIEKKQHKTINATNFQPKASKDDFDYNWDDDEDVEATEVKDNKLYTQKYVKPAMDDEFEEVWD